MNSFIELDGPIFIRPEDITAIEVEGGTREIPSEHGSIMTMNVPNRVLVRVRGVETPYSSDFPSFESAKEQARILAEKVDAILNPRTELTSIEKAITEV
jgi:hypothetical protein